MLTIFAFALQLLLVAGVTIALLRLQQKFGSLRARMSNMALPRPTEDASPIIAIEILNPFELAEQAHPLGAPMARVAPKVIQKIVYERTAEQIIEQLKLRGVEAQVKVHGT